MACVSRHPATSSVSSLRSGTDLDNASGKTLDVSAHHDVILSAGVLETPRFLRPHRGIKCRRWCHRAICRCDRNSVQSSSWTSSASRSVSKIPIPEDNERHCCSNCVSMTRSRSRYILSTLHVKPHPLQHHCHGLGRLVFRDSAKLQAA